MCYADNSLLWYAQNQIRYRIVWKAFKDKISRKENKLLSLSLKWFDGGHFGFLIWHEWQSWKRTLNKTFIPFQQTRENIWLSLLWNSYQKYKYGKTIQRTFFGSIWLIGIERPFLSIASTLYIIHVIKLTVSVPVNRSGCLPMAKFLWPTNTSYIPIKWYNVCISTDQYYTIT